MPAAIYTDAVHDAKFPASISMVVLHIPTHGVRINGLAYLPVGAAPHPVICHGLPGNEKNFDLAQAVRRAGRVAVTFNYRGAWGSPGRRAGDPHKPPVGSIHECDSLTVAVADSC